MAKRLTAQQKEDARQQRQMESDNARRREAIDNVKQRLKDARDRIVYRHDLAWSFPEGSIAYTLSSDELAERRRQANAIWSLVSELERTRQTLRTNLERVQRRAADALERLTEGKTGSGYSTMLGDLPADVEQGSAKLDGLIGGIAQLAYATGWYVPDIYSVQRRAAHAILVGLDVVCVAQGRYLVRSMRDDGAWFLAGPSASPTVNAAAATEFEFVLGDPENMPQVVVYADDDSAWFALAAYVNEKMRWL